MGDVTSETGEEQLVALILGQLFELLDIVLREDNRHSSQVGSASTNSESARTKSLEGDVSSREVAMPS